MECKRKECVKQYQSLVAERSGGDDDADDLAHCGEHGCHNIYWADNNGARCEECFSDACEACVCDAAKGCAIDDSWYCADCRDRLVHEKQLTQCQNPKKRGCHGYAHPRDFACTRCRVVVCDDCFTAVFGNQLGSDETLCRACVAQLKNRK